MLRRRRSPGNGRLNFSVQNWSESRRPLVRSAQLAGHD
jgi:hypothetical protein